MKKISNCSFKNVVNLLEYQQQIKINDYFEQEGFLDPTRPKKTIIESIYLDVN